MIVVLDLINDEASIGFLEGGLASQRGATSEAME